MHCHPGFFKVLSRALDLVRRVVAENRPQALILRLALVKPASGTADLPGLILALGSGDIACGTSKGEHWPSRVRDTSGPAVQAKGNAGVGHSTTGQPMNVWEGHQSFGPGERATRRAIKCSTLGAG